MIRRAIYHAFGYIARGKIARIESDSHTPRAAQWSKLQAILSANADTEFGRENSFASIKNEKDFRTALPIRDYEQLRPYVNRMAAGEKNVLTSQAPFMFATTSGTSGKQKLIPVTPGYMEEFREASVVSGFHLLRSFPQISGGVTMSVVSPAEEGRTAGGIPYGAISGQLFRHEPFLIKKYISAIPYEVFLIEDYEAKYYTLLRLALAMPLSCFYTLNPSTISLLCRRLSQYAPALIDDVRKGTINPPAPLADRTRAAVKHLLGADRARADFLANLLNEDAFVPHRIWPELSVISCWTKAAAAFYLADFPQYFGNIPVCDITYGASEGRGTVFMGPGKQMLAIHSHFFEFVPEEEMDAPNPAVLLAHELEVGKNYFILFTTSGGLYRYNINDVMKVTGFYNNTPMLEFQYKGGNVCSFTGEKLTELQVTDAVRTVAQQTSTPIRYFTLVPTFRPDPHYELWLEFVGAHLPVRPQGPQDFANLCDQQLKQLNIEYATKRDSNRLAPITARTLTPGTYESLRKHLVSTGIADAQIKPSHLNPKECVRDFLSAQLSPDLVGCAR